MGPLRYWFGIPAALGALLCSVFASQTHAGPSVTLVGDDTAGIVIRELAATERSEIRLRDDVYELSVVSAGVTVRSLAPGAGATAMADLLQVTDIALIVMDSTVGPSPVIREHVLIARQARVPMLAMLLTNVDRLYATAPEDGTELLVLEVQEMRELLSTYDLDGNAIRVYVDARPPESVAGIAAFGQREALRALSRFAPQRVRSADTGQVSQIWGAVYLLTGPEADGHAISLAPHDSIVVWSEGTQSKATLSSVSEYYPGDFREMSLSLRSAVRGMVGSRILLVRGERVVGLGAITEITR
jgi:translation elongation factor EF-Tu-like GTPase